MRAPADDVLESVEEARPVLIEVARSLAAKVSCGCRGTLRRARGRWRSRIRSGASSERH